MKTFVRFLLTCFISTCAFMGALNSKTPLVLLAVGFAAWALFFWGWNRRIKKDAKRREMEQQFQDFMRHQNRSVRR